MMKWGCSVRQLLFILAALSCGGCSDSPKQIMGSIGPSGGTVAMADGSAQVAVPANAVNTTTAISITTDTTSVPAALGFAVSPVYHFQPDGLQLAQPATVTLGVHV